MYEMTDTNRMKATLLRYGGKLWGRSPIELIEGHYNRRKWYIDSIPPRLNWTIHPYYIDTCNIEAMIQHTFDEYCCLPISDTVMNKDIQTDNIKLLYLDPTQNVYTVEIEWSFPSLDKTYILVVNVTKNKGRFEICGLNKPYCGYAMNFKNNGRMIQRKMNETTIIVY